MDIAVENVDDSSVEAKKDVGTGEFDKEVEMDVSKGNAAVAELGLNYQEGPQQHSEELDHGSPNSVTEHKDGENCGVGKDIVVEFPDKFQFEKKENDDAQHAPDSDANDCPGNGLKDSLICPDSEQKKAGASADLGSTDHSDEPVSSFAVEHHENIHCFREQVSVKESTSTVLISEESSRPQLAEGGAGKAEEVQDGASCSGSEYLKGFQLKHLIENIDALIKSQAVDVNEKDEQRTVANESKKIQFADEASGESRIHTSLPAGLGRGSPLLMKAMPRATQQSHVNGAFSDGQARVLEETLGVENEEKDEAREKLEMIRVTLLRLAKRLGQTPRNPIVAKVLYRIGLVEQLRGRNRGGQAGAFSFDRASAMAEQLEAAGQEPLDFSCTILVIGKTGEGKSATINSIFDEAKFGTDAFKLGTKKVQDVVGTIQGIKVRVIDTPGLLSSCRDQRQNEKTLSSVKRFIKKNPPDIVWYLDRLDVQGRDQVDMPLLRSITKILGPSIWFNAILVLTHAGSSPPDRPNGMPSTYDTFVTQRSQLVQQLIRQAAGDMRLMNPVSLVENHSACRVNRGGQRVLPNGEIWKHNLLLLSFVSIILAEANKLLKPQDSPPRRSLFSRYRAPGLPSLLSSSLQSIPQVRLPEEQDDDEDILDDDLVESSDSDGESEELPPFRHLTKAELNKLTKAQRNSYFDELDYRNNFLMKKQRKEYRRYRKMLKKMEALAKDLPKEFNENVEEDYVVQEYVSVPEPERQLPDSFDSDYPSHRYRHLSFPGQWSVIPVLDTQGWDHDVGYEGINMEHLFVVKGKVPISFSGRIRKDKEDTNLQMDVNSSIKHGEGKATSLGFNMQTVGEFLSYTLRSEARFSCNRQNKAAAGLTFNLLGDTLSAGAKIEDKLMVNKHLQLAMSGGAMTRRGDVAYGGSLEATLRDKDYPLGRSQSSFGLSAIGGQGNLFVGCGVQSQIPIGRHTNMKARVSLYNRGAGQVSLSFNSSEQLQLALIGLVPLLQKLLGNCN